MLLESLSSASDSVIFPALSRNDGISPLIMAAAMNHDLCVDVLLTSGADPNEESRVRHQEFSAVEVMNY